MEWTVSKRSGKIFLDHNQNVRGKNMASIYSLRPLAGAPVSTPLRWDELGEVYPTDFTIDTAPERVDDLGDLWGRGARGKTRPSAPAGVRGVGPHPPLVPPSENLRQDRSGRPAGAPLFCAVRWVGATRWVALDALVSVVRSNIDRIIGRSFAIGAGKRLAWTRLREEAQAE